MEKTDAIIALSALAQDNRLDAYRLLVQAGPDGMPAGEVAARLGLPPNTLTFHFDRLRQAGLVTVRRNGRSMIYAARFDTMNALRFMRNLVGAGSACSLPLNTWAKRGSTNVSRKMVTPTAMVPMMPG